MKDFESFMQSHKVSDQMTSNADSSDDNYESSQNLDDEYSDNDREYVKPSKKQRLQTFNGKRHGKTRKLSSASSKTENTHTIERLPTRRPDPMVQNRNALMARENRKKKKQHVQLLENELDICRRENKCLRKILKSREQDIDKLTHETLYLRSIIANKTAIMSMLKTIKGNKLPLTSSTLSFVTEDDDQFDGRVTGSEASRSPATSIGTTTITTTNGDEEKENDFDIGFSNTSVISDELAMGNWKSLLNEDDSDYLSPPSADIPDRLSSIDADMLSNVENEHNYYFNNNTDVINQKKSAEDMNPGICLHLSAGRVSLEFCSSCHSSSQNAWFEEM